MNLRLYTYILLAILAGCMFTACDDDEAENDEGNSSEIVASFQFEIDSDNFLQVTFSNFSQNASSYSWDFGDGNSSTEDSPVHTYETEGTYTVKLTASNDADQSSEVTKEVVITDPNVAGALLTGTTSKTWKLYREGTSMQLVPFWPGLTNDGSRNCLYEHEFTFHADGEYVFNDNGGFWGEFGVWPSEDPNFESCFEPTAENMVADGVDVSAWASGTHSFTYDTDAGKITLNGTGAWIGIPKLGTDAEHGTNIPESVTFDVSIEEQEGFDLMTVTFDYGESQWVIVYASYDDPANELGLPTTPIAGFTFVQDESDKKMFTFTNTSNENADTYAWDFGDGNSSTETNPTHTYAMDGTYTITLTATNGSSGESDMYSEIVTTVECVDETNDDATDPANNIALTWKTEDAFFGQFGNIGSERVSNPFIDEGNESCQVFKYTKTTGCETWSGVAYTVSDVTFNFTSQGNIFTMDAYGVQQGTTVKLRFEKNPSPDSEPSVERTAELTAAGEWQQLTFDFSDDESNNNYTVMIIYFEQGAACDGDIYYVDNLIQSSGS